MSLIPRFIQRLARWCGPDSRHSRVELTATAVLASDGRRVVEVQLGPQLLEQQPDCTEIVSLEPVPLLAALGTAATAHRDRKAGAYFVPARIDAGGAIIVAGGGRVGAAERTPKTIDLGALTDRHFKRHFDPVGGVRFNPEFLRDLGQTAMDLGVRWLLLQVDTVDHSLMATGDVPPPETKSGKPVPPQPVAGIRALVLGRNDDDA